MGIVWSRFNAWITPMLVTTRGLEKIDRKQSYVVVSNHQSQYDIFVLYGWLGIDFKWVMKQELRKIPGLGIACEKIGHIFIGPIQYPGGTGFHQCGPAENRQRHLRPVFSGGHPQHIRPNGPIQERGF